MLARLAGRIGIRPRTLLIGIALPVAAIVVVIATAAVAPRDETPVILMSAFLGVAAGLASALAGVFGGVMVPGLLLLGIDPRFAAAVTLFLQVLVIPLAAGSHYRLGNFSRSVALPLLLGGMIGAFVGPFFAALLPDVVIARVVAVLIIAIGLVVLAAQRRRSFGQSWSAFREGSSYACAFRRGRV